MKKVLLGILALLMLVSLVVLNDCWLLFENGHSNFIISYCCDYLNPLIFISIIVIAYFVFKGCASFTSRWTWVALSIALMLLLARVDNLLQVLVKAVNMDALYFIYTILAIIGICIIIVALLCKKIAKLMAIGFVFVAAEYVLIAVSVESIKAVGIASVVVNVLLCIFTAFMALCPKLKFNRSFSRFFIALGAIVSFSLMKLEGYLPGEYIAGLHFAVLAVILAFLIAPGIKALRFSLSKFAGFLCLVTIVLSLSAFFGDIDVPSKDRELIRFVIECVATVLSSVALLLLSIGLFRGKLNKLAFTSYGMICVTSVIYMTDKYNYDAALNYTAYGFIEKFFELVSAMLSSPYFWSIIAFSFLAIIMMKKQGKLIRYRVFTILFSLVLIYVSYSLEFYTVIFTLYAIILLLTSIVLVPPTFTEYNNIAKHIFFSIVTLGVWQLIWIYNVTKNLCKVEAVEKRKAGLELFLCIFLPFYVVYWVYKTAEGVEKYGEENGYKFDISILCLAFSFVCPLISTVIIQDKINKIVGKPE